MKIEKLRYSRKKLPTAGSLLFSCTTWMQGALSQPPSSWKPLPVWSAVAESLQPILVSLETEQSVFYAGSSVSSHVYVVNDDARFRDLHGLILTLSVIDENGKVLTQQQQTLGDVSYYDVKKCPVEWRMPNLTGDRPSMVPATIRLDLRDLSDDRLAENTYPIRLAARSWARLPARKLAIRSYGCDGAIKDWLAGIDSRVNADDPPQADVVVLGPKAGLVGESSIRKLLRPGGRLLIIENPANEAAYCSEFIRDGRAPDKTPGEFVEMLNWSSHPQIFDGLDPMDWKWWAHSDTSQDYSCLASHRLAIDAPGVKPLGRYLAPHFYWSGNTHQIYQDCVSYPVFSVSKPWGDVVVCDLTLSESLELDPRAGKTFNNLVEEPLE